MEVRVKVRIEVGGGTVEVPAFVSSGLESEGVKMTALYAPS